MRKAMRRRPTPAMGVALLALFVALGGTSVALNKGEKKQIRKIAKKQANKRINQKAPDLHVGTAKTANSAGFAHTATAANQAGNANNANALGGVPLAGLVPVAENTVGGVCDPDNATFDNCSQVEISTTRRSDIVLLASATWHEPGGTTSVEGRCRVQGPGGTTGSRIYGTIADDTNNQHPRAVSFYSVAEDQPPGTHTYAFQCLEMEGDFATEQNQIVAIGAGG